jgi:hypothetical protein
MSRGSPSKSKPLIKSSAKVKKGKEEETEDILQEIMAHKSKHPAGKVHPTKPDILINARKSSRADNSEAESISKHSQIE